MILFSRNKLNVKEAYSAMTAMFSQMVAAHTVVVVVILSNTIGKLTTKLSAMYLLLYGIQEEELSTSAKGKLRQKCIFISVVLHG